MHQIKSVVHNCIGLSIFMVIMLGFLNSSPVLSAEDEDGGIPVVGGVIYPSLGVSSFYNDNVLLQDKKAKDSFVIVTSPRVKYYSEGDITQFTLDMGIDDGYYTHSHNDNYFDLDAKADISFYPTDRITFFGGAGYKKGHEARGEGSQSGSNVMDFENPDRYRLWGVEAGIKYGVEKVGMPRIETSYTHNERRYSNNIGKTKFQERNTDNIYTTLFYQILPNTSLLVEGRLSRFSYKKGNVNGELDSSQYAVLGGLSWQATYQTEGYFKIGWNEKFFDADERGSSSNISWEVGFDWKPLPYSMISFSTSQKLEEADGLGSDVNVRSVDLSWKHAWQDWLYSTLTFYYRNEDFSGNSIFSASNISRDREDDDFGVGLNMDYEFRRWLTLGLDYSYSIRSSTQENFDFNRNIIGLHAVFSL